MSVGRQKAESSSQVRMHIFALRGIFLLTLKTDGYDLPPALKDWLYPTDGTTRDYASLQVVFGRGEEYFASDKNGKLEYKEPEIKKPAPSDDDEKLDKQALRRSRTVSFLRPLSETSTRSESSASES